MLFEILTGGVFPETYDVKDCSFDFSGWRDDIGLKFVNKVKAIPYNYNSAQDAFWNKAKLLKDLDEDEIKYDSKRYDIERLKVDD